MKDSELKPDVIGITLILLGLVILLTIAYIGFTLQFYSIFSIIVITLGSVCGGFVTLLGGLLFKTVLTNHKRSMVVVEPSPFLNESIYVLGPFRSMRSWWESRKAKSKHIFVRTQIVPDTCKVSDGRKVLWEPK